MTTPITNPNPTAKIEISSLPPLVVFAGRDSTRKVPTKFHIGDDSFTAYDVVKKSRDTRREIVTTNADTVRNLGDKPPSTLADYMTTLAMSIVEDPLVYSSDNPNCIYACSPFQTEDNGYHPRRYHCSIYIGNATKLPQVDKFGTIDPYIAVYIGSFFSIGTPLAKSKVFKKNQNPNWNQILDIKGTFNSMHFCRKIFFVLHDWNLVLKKRFVGSDFWVGDFWAGESLPFTTGPLFTAFTAGVVTHVRSSLLESDLKRWNSPPSLLTRQIYFHPPQPETVQPVISKLENSFGSKLSNYSFDQFAPPGTIYNGYIQRASQYTPISVTFHSSIASGPLDNPQMYYTQDHANVNFSSIDFCSYGKLTLPAFCQTSPKMDFSLNFRAMALPVQDSLDNTVNRFKKIQKDWKKYLPKGCLDSPYPDDYCKFRCQTHQKYPCLNSYDFITEKILQEHFAWLSLQDSFTHNNIKGRKVTFNGTHPAIATTFLKPPPEVHCYEPIKEPDLLEGNMRPRTSSFTLYGSPDRSVLFGDYPGALPPFFPGSTNDTFYRPTIVLFRNTRGYSISKTRYSPLNLTIPRVCKTVFRMESSLTQPLEISSSTIKCSQCDELSTLPHFHCIDCDVYGRQFHLCATCMGYAKDSQSSPALEENKRLESPTDTHRFIFTGDHRVRRAYAYHYIHNDTQMYKEDMKSTLRTNPDVIDILAFGSQAWEGLNLVYIPLKSALPNIRHKHHECAAGTTFAIGSKPSPATETAEAPKTVKPIPIPIPPPELPKPSLRSRAASFQLKGLVKEQKRKVNVVDTHAQQHKSRHKTPLLNTPISLQFESLLNETPSSTVETDTPELAPEPAPEPAHEPEYSFYDYSYGKSSETSFSTSSYLDSVGSSTSSYLDSSSSSMNDFIAKETENIIQQEKQALDEYAASVPPTKITKLVTCTLPALDFSKSFDMKMALLDIRDDNTFPVYEKHLKKNGITSSQLSSVLSSFYNDDKKFNNAKWFFDNNKIVDINKLEADFFSHLYPDSLADRFRTLS